MTWKEEEGRRKEKEEPYAPLLLVVSEWSDLT